jgi:hypothetical protein
MFDVRLPELSLGDGQGGQSAERVSTIAITWTSNIELSTSNVERSADFSP